jgi:hypothetical protein
MATACRSQGTIDISAVAHPYDDHPASVVVNLEYDPVIAYPNAVAIGRFELADAWRPWGTA